MEWPTAAAVRQGCSFVLSACCLLSVIRDLTYTMLPTAAAVRQSCSVVLSWYGTVSYTKYTNRDINIRDI